jgi:hypothetical protein
LSTGTDRPSLLEINGAVNYEFLGRGLSAQAQQMTDFNFDREAYKI